MKGNLTSLILINDMEIKNARQNTLEEIQKLDFDFIIGASGYESRARYFYSKFCPDSDFPSKKICLTFEDRKLLSRSDNDKFFLKEKFEEIKLSKSNLKDIIDIYSDIFPKTNKDSIKVLFDYSCMTKIMYAALLKYFEIYNDLFREVSIFFVYTEALFTKPPESQSNFHNQPLPLISSFEMTDKRIALIVGLGYEPGKAQGLIEYMQIESSDIYLFRTSKVDSEEFYKEVSENNTYVLAKIPTANRFEYELHNLTHLLNLLESISIYLLSNSYRVIIAPLGPKVFSLMSILLTIKHNSLTVLRVSDGIKGDAIDKLPNQEKPFNILEVNMKQFDKVE
jgi:hypothetical protein